VAAVGVTAVGSRDGTGSSGVGAACLRVWAASGRTSTTSPRNPPPVPHRETHRSAGAVPEGEGPGASTGRVPEQMGPEPDEPAEVSLVFRWWNWPLRNPPDGGLDIPAGQRHFLWSGRRDSNPRPPPWQGGALPTEPRPHAPRGHSESRHWDAGLQRPPLRAGQAPVDPNPPWPRLDDGSSSTQDGRICGRATTTSCAIRSPLLIFTA